MGLHMDPHMDVYPPGGEDVDLPAGRVFCAVVLFGRVDLCCVDLCCADLCHGLATSAMGSCFR